MIKGVITCKCGQLFGFETEQKSVDCPNCKNEYIAAQYEVIEEPQSEATEDGTNI